MVKRKQADAFEFVANDDEQDALITLGKQLSNLPKSKDTLLRLLKKAGGSLEVILQGSEGATLAIGDLSKALGRKELVKHKDKEIKLRAAFCLCQVLRIYAPNTPYTDDDLKGIFGLFNMVFGELEDQASASFPLCLSILETVSQVKCCVLLLDLDADDIVSEIFSSLFGAINEENREMLHHSALELMGSLLEECDFLSQQLLDIVLVNVLPNKEQENRAACRLAQELLRRTEMCIQPYLQKFLTNTLLGIPTESDLKDDCHKLIFQLYQVVPQVLLPVLPHLSLELQVDSESKRLSAVDLLGNLFTQPGSSDISKDYAELFQDLLKRLHDQKVEVRLKVLTFCKDLLDNCADVSTRRYIIQGILDRLLDVDDRVRIAAADTFCGIMGENPKLATTGLDPVLGRLRDKKLNVRKEVASQVMGLIRTWCVKLHQNIHDAPKLQQIIAPLLVLCNLATRDADLGSYVIDNLFKCGVFPPKIPEATQVQWWAYMWQKAGDVGKASLAKLLKNKCSLQRQVQDLLHLRAAAKEQRQTNCATSSAAASGTGSALQPSTNSGITVVDPEGTLHSRMLGLAKSLHDVPKAEEGVQKLWDLKDNHIFRGLATLATYGTPLEQAAMAGKDVLQRVGAKGVASDAARALVHRMSPSLLSPELLQATTAHAAESEQAQTFLMDMAVMAPQLFAQSMECILSMIEQDDPLLAICAAKVLAKTGKYLVAVNTAHPKDECKIALRKVEGTLLDMCSGSSPTGAKAAVCALITLLGPDNAISAMKRVCDDLIGMMKQPSTMSQHSKLLTAIKVMATVGRMLPRLFINYADEYSEFILNKLLKEDFARGGPLQLTADKAGEEWGRPSPGIALKAAALKCLAQSFVPDNVKFQPCKELTESVNGFLVKLVELVNPDEDSSEFEHLGFVGSIDAAWIRSAAGSCLLRLARIHDHSIKADVYIELALSLQDPHPDARRQLASKVVKTVEHFKASPQRAAKYAALLGLLAVDPVEANQAAAFKSLQEYVAHRRKQVHASAQATAATGGAGNMIQAMPEFVLPFLIFILSHHPDYPSVEEIQEWQDMEDDERAEIGEAGHGSPLAPFQTMLQFVLEPLVLPTDGVISPPDIAQCIPATLKLLRTLKFCEDAVSGDMQHTYNAYQLCDIAMATVKMIVDRVTNNMPLEPGRFPGSVVLPRMCFKPKDMRAEVKKVDGSHLPVHFTPEILNEFFCQRFAKLSLPPSTKKPRARSKLRSRQGNSKQLLQQQESPGRGAQNTSDADDQHVQSSPDVSERIKATNTRQDQQQQDRQKQGVDTSPHPQTANDGNEPGISNTPPKRRKTHCGKPKSSTLEHKGQPPLRMQPRRNAKTAASEKLKEDDREQLAILAGTTDDDAKNDPMSQSDFENASMGSPTPGPPSASQGAARKNTLRLRAETDDENDSHVADARPTSKKRQLPRVSGAKQTKGKGMNPKAPPAVKGARAAKLQPGVLEPRSKNIRN